MEGEGLGPLTAKHCDTHRYQVIRPGEGCQKCNQNNRVKDFLKEYVSSLEPDRLSDVMGVSVLKMNIESGGPYLVYEKTLKDKIAEVQADVEKLQELEWGIGRALKDIIREKVLTGSILTDVIWVYGHGGTIEPDYGFKYMGHKKDAKKDAKQKKAIEDLLDIDDRSSWGININLTKLRDEWGDVTLIEHDSEIRIDFERIEDIIPFCKEFNLNIKFTRLLEKKERLMVELASVKEILEEFEVEVPNPCDCENGPVDVTEGLCGACLGTVPDEYFDDEDSEYTETAICRNCDKVKNNVSSGSAQCYECDFPDFPDKKEDSDDDEEE